MASLRDRQLRLLEAMASLEPAPYIMGGFAEDALLVGAVTRPHGDIDWLFTRRELDVRLRQASSLGFASLETWGEAAPGEPFYLAGEKDDLNLEAGVADEIDGALYVRIYSVAFDIDGNAPPVGYRVRLPDDTFEYPPVALEGIAIQVASPLALYQLRAGIASQGTFGPLSERQLESMSQLQAEFFPDRSYDELLPQVEPLTER
jgi:hypothetical protein